MKTNFLKSLFVIALLLITNVSFSQEVSKAQLITEINKSIVENKMWDYEGLVLDNTGSFKYHICLTPECNPYISWDFYIKNLKPMQVSHFEEYVVINFECKDGDCMIPPGYEKGGRYEMKKNLQFIIKDEKEGKKLVDKLNKLQSLELGK